MPIHQATTTGIPWKVIAASPDMMDQTLGDRSFPPPWRSSLAISVYEPGVEAEEAEALCGQRLAFVKVICSITGYQPASGESTGTIVFDDERFEALDELTSEYLGCYGALLNVAFFPRGGENTTDPSNMPRILDFTPKSRELMRAITQGGEILTGSAREMKIDASRTTTQKSETSVGLQGGRTPPKKDDKKKAGTDEDGGQDGGEGVEESSADSADAGEGNGAGAPADGGGDSGATATGSISHTWGATREDRTAAETSLGETDRGATRYSTSMDQLYSLLTGYHSGTNRATCILLARPGTLEPTNRRTFVQGLRMLEGIQEFIFVVSRPADVPGLCVEAVLDTGHFPDDVPLVGDTQPSDRRTFTFNVFCESYGLAGLVDPYRGEEIRIGDRTEDTFVLPRDERGAWVLDIDAPGTTFGIRRSEDRTRLRGIGGPAPDDRILTHEGHRRIPVNVVRVDDRRVRAMTTATVHARGATIGREHRVDTIVDVDFEIHARRPTASDVEPTADTAHMLVTRRGLTTCYHVEDGCPVVVDPPAALERVGPTEWLERDLGIPRQLHSPERLFQGIQAGLMASARAMEGARVPFSETKHFARRLAARIPSSIGSAPLSQVIDLSRLPEGAAAWADLPVRRALERGFGSKKTDFREGQEGNPGRAVLGELLRALERRMSGGQ